MWGGREEQQVHLEPGTAHGGQREGTRVWAGGRCEEGVGRAALGAPGAPFLFFRLARISLPDSVLRLILLLCCLNICRWREGWQEGGADSEGVQGRPEMGWAGAQRSDVEGWGQGRPEAREALIWNVPCRPGSELNSRCRLRSQYRLWNSCWVLGVGGSLRDLIQVSHYPVSRLLLSFTPFDIWGNQSSILQIVNSQGFDPRSVTPHSRLLAPPSCLLASCP